MYSFYFPNPITDGVFVSNRKKKDFVEGISLYQFDPFEDNERKAHFSLINAPSVCQKISEAEGWESCVKPACDYGTYPKKRIDSVETTIKGEAELLKSGNWKVVKKAKIKYTESDTPEWYKALEKARPEPSKVDEDTNADTAPDLDEAVLPDNDTEEELSTEDTGTESNAKPEPKLGDTAIRDAFTSAERSVRLDFGRKKKNEREKSIITTPPPVYTANVEQSISQGNQVNRGNVGSTPKPDSSKPKSNIKVAVVIAIITVVLVLSFVIYYKAFRDHVKIAENYNEKALSFLEAKNYDAAATQLNKAIKNNPSESKFYDNMGRMYVAKEKYDSAISAYGEAIKLNPQNVDYYVHRAQVFNTKKNYINAVSDYSEAIKLSPQDSFFIVKGQLLFNMSKFDEAIANYTEAINYNSRNASFYAGRGNIYYENKNFAKALSDYSEAISRGLKEAECYFKRGRIYLDIQKYSDAINDFSQALALGYKDADILYISRGDAYLAQKNYPAAEGDYAKALDLSSNAERIAKRGLARHHQKKYEEAIGDFEAALQLNANEPTAKKWLPESKSGQFMEAFMKGLNSSSGGD